MGASLSRSGWGPGEAEGRSTGDGEWGLGSCGRAGRRAFCLPSMYSWGRTYNVAQIILVSVQTRPWLRLTTCTWSFSLPLLLVPICPVSGSLGLNLCLSSLSTVCLHDRRFFSLPLLYPSSAFLLPTFFLYLGFPDGRTSLLVFSVAKPDIH